MPTGVISMMSLKEIKNRYSKEAYKRIKARRNKL